MGTILNGWRLGLLLFAVIALVATFILWLVPAMSISYIEEEPCMIEQVIVVQVPKTVTETYTEKEPYETTETYYEKEPYTTVERTYVSEAYTYYEEISYSMGATDCNDWGWFSDGCDCYVVIRNDDSSHGGRFWASFDITVRGGAATTISESEYIGPGETLTITASYSGAEIQSYGTPDITVPTKEVVGIREVPKTQTVTKYRDVTKTRAVTEWQDVTKTREVNVYKDAEEIQEVMGMCEVEKSKTVPVLEYLLD